MWLLALTEPGSALDNSHSGDAPVLFVVILPLLAAIVLAELTSGGMDAKSVAMLGMLAAVRQDTWVDYVIRIVSIGGEAMENERWAW